MWPHSVSTLTDWCGEQVKQAVQRAWAERPRAEEPASDEVGIPDTGKFAHTCKGSRQGRVAPVSHCWDVKVSAFLDREALWPFLALGYLDGSAQDRCLPGTRSGNEVAVSHRSSPV